MTKKPVTVDPAAPWKRPSPEVKPEATEFSDADIGQILDEDLRERSQALHDAQETWEEVAYLSNPKMPCPECSGGGSVDAGSLGSVCVRCFGARVIDRPGSEPIEQPPFAQLRAAITDYATAARSARLPDGHPGKRQLALTPALRAAVPTLAHIQQLKADAITTAKQLQGASPGVVPDHQLAAPKQKNDDDAPSIGDGYTDADFDEVEEDIAAEEKVSRRKRDAER